MTRIGCLFQNPSTGAQYTWPINYDTMEQWSKERQIDHTAITGETGLVRQQGDLQPLVIGLSGNILTADQLEAFWTYFGLCESQTIYWRDVDLFTYEVMITKFAPIKLRGQNPQDPDEAPLWYWKYTLEMEVLKVFNGPMASIPV